MFLEARLPITIVIAATCVEEIQSRGRVAMIKGNPAWFQPNKRILASPFSVSGREPYERALRQLFYLEFSELPGMLSSPLPTGLSREDKGTSEILLKSKPLIPISVRFQALSQLKCSGACGNSTFDMIFMVIS